MFTAQEVQGWLHRLPECSATVLTMLYFARLTELQISARMGISVDAVRAAGASGLSELGRLIERDIAPAA